MFRMSNAVQEYAWGSTTAFSELFGWDPPGTPQAELWMGAHPKAPSQILNQGGSRCDLPTHLAKHPQDLGPWAAAGTLPFLMKVLAVAAPLSIQAHPTKEQARAGSAAEDAAGVAVASPQRNYVDTNHKPELVVALTEFAALCGIRPPQHSASDLRAVQRLLAEHDAGHGSALEPLCRCLEDDDVAAALRIALESSAAPLGEAASALTELGPLTGQLPQPAADTVERICAAFPADPGLFVALMLQRVQLAPGEALFLPAGQLHAYLGGTAVEVMANSDNVLRGGLTSKHIDVAELLRVVSTEPLPPPAVTPEVRERQLIYRPPAEEFELHRLEFPPSSGEHRLTFTGPAIALITAGQVDSPLGGVAAGESVFIPAGEPAWFHGDSAQMFVAVAPPPQQKARQEAAQ
ncbi:mannose-6-phosphate isomerase, class I [Nesterenkonia sp.]|uniref:mannose-6-phosphate isomerase, class I n=1 Tax=Nesterenkonia sp. TaxID=704201 RepID=UPI00261E48BA|nr:mannose-6-phosphate isomerase, class I [Nesterenkonia sp.]